MKRIGLISDTHSHLEASVLTYFEEMDEIWHAGDIGDLKVMDRLAEIADIRAVYGNIDDHLARATYPKDLRFELDGLDVFMTHIGGYPKRYNKRVHEILRTNPPDLYICGHSHILKVMRDEDLGLIHINPGAAGVHGFHKMKTIIRFKIEAGKIFDLEVIELGLRGALPKE